MTPSRSMDRRGHRRGRRQIALAAGALAAAALAVLLVARPWRSPAAAAVSGERTSPAARAGGIAGAALPAPGAGAALPAELGELVAFLRGRYGKHIASAYVQIQLIEKLMRHFQEQDPSGWQAKLLAAVRAAFPERYAEIAANLQRRLDYEAWLRAEHDRLGGLGDRERRQAIWDERRRLFGEEAAGEIWRSEQKNQALSDALAEIDAQRDATVGDRLAQYKESILETHQEDADAFLANHRQEALSRFLALPSVQGELAALPPEQRSAALRDVRKGLGLDDAALGRWDTLDRERDARWAAGQRYMAERAALARQYAGDALEARLGELRARYFGAEAETIAGEEASGFFRFQEPRRYGLN